MKITGTGRTRAARWTVGLLYVLLHSSCERPHPEQGYLHAAVDSLYTHSLHRAKLDRQALLRQVDVQLTDTSTRAHSHAILNTLVYGIDRHSALFPPGTVRERLQLATDPAQTYPFSCRLLKDRIAFVRVDGFANGDSLSCGLFADSLQRAVLGLHAQRPIGWLIDLRSNTGGNMYPALAGLGPLLGCGDLGWDALPDGTRQAWWYCLDAGHPEGASHIKLVRSPVVLPDTLPAVVLIGPRTGSGGEALAMSFIGRPRTRLFGARTAGFATGNRMCFLADSAILNITNSLMTDRTGGVHPVGIDPHVAFATEEEAFHAAVDSLLLVMRASRVPIDGQGIRSRRP